LWTPTASFNIPAQTYSINSGLPLTIAASATTRTTACITCAPVYTYAVLVAGTFAAVSSSVFTSVTSTSITINTLLSQTDTSFVYRATDNSINPPLVVDEPFTVAWTVDCSLTLFSATTFSVAAMTTYITSPTSAVVT
jgi:hypothetical protein